MSAALGEYRRAYVGAVPLPGRRVVNIDLDARETDWEFTPGLPTRAWTYNGQVPGPLIQATVGDVLEVRLTNNLSEPTILHWHGLRLPAAMDGTEMVQAAVQPGQTFTYRFLLPDAGTFWYHPHTNEPVQMGRGLYGALVVRASDEPAFDRERVFVLADHDTNVRLMNGKAEPELMMWAGQVERWRFVNAASARYVRLSIGGKPFRILGTDGGFVNEPVTVSDVLLTPGERVDLAVGPFAVGERLAIASKPYDAGFGKGRTERFGTLCVGPAAPSVTKIPGRLRSISPLVVGPVAATREVRFSSRPGSCTGADYLINDELHHRAPDVIVGELQVWDLVNLSEVDHPFHLHGFFFQVVDRDGQPPAFQSWEDTVNVPVNGRVRIAWIADDRPGEWMYHCHILEHHAAGMMAHFVVRRHDARAETVTQGHIAGHCPTA